jgi:hypothetical protein
MGKKARSAPGPEGEEAPEYVIALVFFAIE